MDLPYKLWAEYATLLLTSTSICHSTDSNFCLFCISGDVEGGGGGGGVS